MIRMPFAVAVTLAALTAGTSRADTLPLFSEVPATYIPGSAFTFQIVVPEINGLSAFNVDLIFDATVNSPDLNVSAAASMTEYVFTTTSTFSSNSFTGPGLNEVSVQFSDSTLNPVSTVTGVNDVLGIVTVSPGADLTGPITISFDASTFVDYFSEGFDNLPGSVTVDQGTPPPPAVPTPAAWLSMAIGVLILAGRERLKKRI
jgi:hypothetical protein